MPKRNRKYDNKILMVFESGTLVPIFTLAVFAAVSYFFNPVVFWIELAVTFMLAVYYIATERYRKRSLSRYMETLTYHVDSAAKNALLNFPLPMMVVQFDGIISWYNEDLGRILSRKDEYIAQRNIAEIMPGFDLEGIISDRESLRSGVEVGLGERHFIVYFNIIEPTNKTSGLVTLYFVERTELITAWRTVEEKQAVVAILMIDNYDDIMQNLGELEKANIRNEIDKHISKWAADAGALVQKYDRDKMVAVFETKALAQMTEEKFSVLENVKSLHVGPSNIPATISIGMGREAEGFAKKLEYARAAIDIALARGGDQVVIKNDRDFEFFGGVAKELEKRTKVRSRVMATALREIIAEHSRIFIMGHNNADADALGSATGIFRIAKNLGKHANIILGSRSPTISKVLESLVELEDYIGVFMTPATALEELGSNDLLIVVDTNNPSYVESPEIVGKCRNLVVIDHHRRGVGTFEKMALNFHEPFASSASEMVTEILEYLEEDGNICKEEATALLAGIILDTKSFVQKTGVRTFEAASYLKRLGADPSEAKAYFKNDFGTFKVLNGFVSCAKEISRGIMLAYSGEEIEGLTRDMLAQAVDEILEFNGVNAAFGLALIEDKIIISARSFGSVNVQIVMEKMGGGGHQTVAGTQMSEISPEKARELLISIVKQTVSQED